MIDFLVEGEMPFAVVLTKRDKLSPRQQAERLEAFRKEIPYGDQIVMLPVSSETGEGIEAVREVIGEIAADCAAHPAAGSPEPLEGEGQAGQGFLAPRPRKKQQ